MKKKGNLKTIIWILVLFLFAGLIAVFGYRVIVTADEVPGKLSSISVAAGNLNYSGCTMKKVQKVSYDVMKYGYMDDLLLAQMDTLDARYEFERMEEIRAINNLTAMSEKTADKLAYQQAKAQREEAEKIAKEAARLAQMAKEAKIRMVAQQIREKEEGNSTVSTGGSGNTGSGDTASKGGKKGEPVYASTHGDSLGKFVITAYCTCRVCCGVYSGGNRTASGTVPTSNHTIAVDTSVIPFGTKVVINGQVYVAEDRGGAIKGKRIDMFFMTHSEALRWGRRTMEVYLAD
ncbi:MAG: hypothetical protein HFJ06_04140 [Lachnospiraceae bacterium]|nr:hypothetical protein [Lachnospiraceae bacterium]